MAVHGRSCVLLSVDLSIALSEACVLAFFDPGPIGRFDQDGFARVRRSVGILKLEHVQDLVDRFWRAEIVERMRVLLRIERLELPSALEKSVRFVLLEHDAHVVVELHPTLVADVDGFVEQVGLDLGPTVEVAGLPMQCFDAIAHAGKSG